MAKLTARDGGANIYDISVCRRHQTVSVQTLSLQMRAFPVYENPAHSSRHAGGSLPSLMVR